MQPRLPAEWEKQSAIQFTFPHENSDWAYMLDIVEPCFVRLIEATSRYQKVVVVCQNAPKVAELLRGGMPEGTNGGRYEIQLVELPSNDTWARDHAAITVFDDNQPVLIDFVFNGWGLKFAADQDNQINQRLFEKGVFQAKNIKKGGIVLEGGGIESDGQGTLLTTSECLLSPNRNPHLSKKQIEKHLKKLFGVQRILWLNHGYLAGDDTDSHIDTLARLCDPNSICYVQCLDKKDEHYKALKKMEAELQRFQKADGQPYNLIPLPMTDPIFDAEGQRLPATYANFLIINGAVLVPTYGVPQDEIALNILRGVFSDRDIVGLDCRPLIEQHGSLHCVTMQFPVGVI
jgi:agmatine deiminase